MGFNVYPRAHAANDAFGIWVLNDNVRVLVKGLRLGSEVVLGSRISGVGLRV